VVWGSVVRSDQSRSSMSFAVRRYPTRAPGQCPMIRSDIMHAPFGRDPILCVHPTVFLTRLFHQRWLILLLRSCGWEVEPDRRVRANLKTYYARLGVSLVIIDCNGCHEASRSSAWKSFCPLSPLPFSQLPLPRPVESPARAAEPISSALVGGVIGQR
jgi:hypothetical protein